MSICRSSSLLKAMLDEHINSSGKEHTMSADHLDNQSTFSLVRVILDVDFTFFDGGILIPGIYQAPLEDGE